MHLFIVLSGVVLLMLSYLPLAAATRLLVKWCLAPRKPYKAPLSRPYSSKVVSNFREKKHHLPLLEIRVHLIKVALGLDKHVLRFAHYLRHTYIYICLPSAPMSTQAPLLKPYAFCSLSATHIYIYMSPFRSNEHASTLVFWGASRLLLVRPVPQPVQQV